MSNELEKDENDILYFIGFLKNKQVRRIYTDWIIWNFARLNNLTEEQSRVIISYFLKKEIAAIEETHERIKYSPVPGGNIYDRSSRPFLLINEPIEVKSKNIFENYKPDINFKQELFQKIKNIESLFILRGFQEIIYSDYKGNHHEIQTEFFKGINIDTNLLNKIRINIDTNLLNKLLPSDKKAFCIIKDHYTDSRGSGWKVPQIVLFHPLIFESLYIPHMDLLITKFIQKIYSDLLVKYQKKYGTPLFDVKNKELQLMTKIQIELSKGKDVYTFTCEGYENKLGVLTKKEILSITNDKINKLEKWDVYYEFLKWKEDVALQKILEEFTEEFLTTPVKIENNRIVAIGENQNQPSLSEEKVEKFSISQEDYKVIKAIKLKLNNEGLSDEYIMDFISRYLYIGKFGIQNTLQEELNSILNCFRIDYHKIMYIMEDYGKRTKISEYHSQIIQRNEFDRLTNLKNEEKKLLQLSLTKFENDIPIYYHSITEPKDCTENLVDYFVYESSLEEFSSFWALEFSENCPYKSLNEIEKKLISSGLYIQRYIQDKSRSGKYHFKIRQLELIEVFKPIKDKIIDFIKNEIVPSNATPSISTNTIISESPSEMPSQQIISDNLKEKPNQSKQIKSTEYKQYRIFISYYTDDKDAYHIPEIVKKLKGGYSDIGDVLFWEENATDDIKKYMKDELINCDILLLMCSPNALTSPPVKSEWTQMKIHHGIERIIPVFYDPTDIPAELNNEETSIRGIKFNPLKIDESISKIHELIKKRLTKSI